MTDTVVETDVPMATVTLQDVQIFEDHVRVKLDGGVEKIISVIDFRDIINRSLGRLEDERLEGFNLPSNVFYFAKSAGTVQVSCYYQSRTADILYHSDKINVVLPNIIISHVLLKNGEKDWRVSSTKYFCTDFSVSRLPKTFINSVDRTQHIFVLPMSNTYREGNMCYGNNSMITRFTENNLRGLDWYYQYLFESPFNDDLGIAAIGSSDVKSWYRKLEALAKEGKPFPYEMLTGYSPA